MVNRFFGLGEIVLDVVMKDRKPLAAVAGGSTFNSMISLGRVSPESEIYMISQTGDDKVADLILDFTAENNVSSKYIKKIKGTQSVLSLAFLNERNDSSYEFFRDSHSPVFETDKIEFRNGDIVLFGSFFAVGSNTREQTRRLIRDAKNSGAFVYYDINFRKNHLDQLNNVKIQIEHNCSISDVVRASSEDIFNLYGEIDADKAYFDHISNFCPNFIYTSGAGPTYLFRGPDQREEYLPEKIDTVSTIGAGDNFNAGFIYAYSKYGIGGDLLRIASMFSSNVCQSLYNYVDSDFRARYLDNLDIIEK